MPTVSIHRHRTRFSLAFLRCQTRDYCLFWQAQYLGYVVNSAFKGLRVWHGPPKTTLLKLSFNRLSCESNKWLLLLWLHWHFIKKIDLVIFTWLFSQLIYLNIANSCKRVVIMNCIRLNFYTINLNISSETYQKKNMYFLTVLKSDHFLSLEHFEINKYCIFKFLSCDFYYIRNNTLFEQHAG